MALLAMPASEHWIQFISLVILYQIVTCLYNAFFSPLASFPGRLLWRCSRIPHSLSKVRGTLTKDILDMHEKYGPVIRVAPNELSFAHPKAWQEIMGSLSSGGNDLDKWDLAYMQPGDDQNHRMIVNAKRPEHARMRKVMQPGFSDRALRAYEPAIRRYVDLLISRLQDRADGKTSVDVKAWYNFTTFDITGDIVFGESFDCLERSEYHPWITTAFDNVFAATLIQAIAHWPWLIKLLLAIGGRRAEEIRSAYVGVVEGKLKHRIDMGQDARITKNDILDGLLDGHEAGEWSYNSLVGTSLILLIGGSETAATLLSGATYLLLTNPSKLEILKKEIRGSFRTEEEITSAAVANLPYLNAVIQESLRRYPPVALSMNRITPEGGSVICGKAVPGETAIGIHQWAMYHNTNLFVDPYGFHPERWLAPDADPQGVFVNDHREVVQAFHLGPRNCIGKQLAYHEIRLILCRMLFAFDIELATSSIGWMEKQKAYILWEKVPLNMILKPVRD